jgi:hypothetical protein
VSHWKYFSHIWTTWNYNQTIEVKYEVKSQGRLLHTQNVQVVTDLQTSCNKVVVKPISGCVRTCLFALLVSRNKLLSSCYKVDNGNRFANTSCSKRLIQAVRNKLLRACCHQPVNNLLRAYIRPVGTTCCESVGLTNLVTKWWHLVDKLWVFYTCMFNTIPCSTM